MRADHVHLKIDLGSPDAVGCAAPFRQVALASMRAARHLGPVDGPGVRMLSRRQNAGAAASAVDKLLSRLQRVKRTGPGRWIASSPTREDRHPSLAIRELEDGRILIHDFGGDDVGSIVAALGLELADLFPARQGHSARPISRPFNAADVLGLVSFEAGVAVVVCVDVLRNRAVAEAEFDRLMVAAQRLADAAEVCNAYR